VVRQQRLPRLFDEPYEVAANGNLLRKHIQPDLLESLKQDVVPFVRASLYVNSKIRDWQQRTHLEPPRVDGRDDLFIDFVVKLFDTDDTDLGLSHEDRKDLAVAFLHERSDTKVAGPSGNARFGIG
jgi:hypothetical protein